MMTSAASTATDRSDFRTVMIAGTKTGALIALAVVVFLAATRVLGPGGGARRARVPAPVGLAAPTAGGFLPGPGAGSGAPEGGAGRGGSGVGGAMVFSVIEIP